VQQVEERAKKQRELDYKIKLNDRKLSEKYLKLVDDSPSRSCGGDGKVGNSSTDRSISNSDSEPKNKPKNQQSIDERLRKEALIRQLAEYDELESKKNLKLHEQERELALRNMKLLPTDGTNYIRAAVAIKEEEKFKEELMAGENGDDGEGLAKEKDVGEEKENSTRPVAPKRDIDKKRETLVFVLSIRD
jgi:hypothetical protein